MSHYIKHIHFKSIFFTLFLLLISYSAYNYESDLNTQAKLIFELAVGTYLVIFMFSIINKYFLNSQHKFSMFHWDLF